MTAIENGLPLLVVAALWFGSTALVVWLDSRHPRTFGRSLGVAGLLAIAAALVLALTARDASIPAAYASFAAALVIWGWLEMSFLTGIVTGPNRTGCAPGTRGWARFYAAAGTLIYHEVTLAVTAALLLGFTWGLPNAIGADTFALLFAMRLSAKLNIFLGVPAFADELLPPHLAYLKSCFRRGPVNPLFPIALALALGATGWFGAAAITADGGAAVGWTLLFGLAALGTLEHIFLVLPIADAAMWRWAREGKPAAKTAATAIAMD